MAGSRQIDHKRRNMDNIVSSSGECDIQMLGFKRRVLFGAGRSSFGGQGGVVLGGRAEQF